MAARGRIGAELRALRLATGISVVEAARRAAVSRSALHRWEAGESAPERAALDRLLAGLDAEPRARARLLAAREPRRAVPELATHPLGAPAHPGLILKALRARRGLSQTGLAREVGTTQATVARWESGAQAPRGELLARALAALGASAAEAGWLREDAPDDYEPVRTVEEARARLRPLSGYDAPIAALIALEREVWERAARDPRWEGTLAEVASARSTAHAYAGEPDASLDAANRALRLIYRSMEGSPDDEPPDLDDLSEVNTVVYRSGCWEGMAERRFRRDDIPGALAALEQTPLYRREGHSRLCCTMGYCLSALRRAGERPWPSLVASFERQRRRPNLTPWERSLLAKHEAWLGLEPLLP